ncbi:phosphotransferase [Streptomyces sp. NPDC057746]|uniref:phosphotransferase n=1 Tax=Streptomyces sp. NPDC057746 TaxID=3346237 RepID=UPI0036B759C5
MRDTSHPRENSQVWKVTGRNGDHYVKVAPALYTRETRAYREAVPHLGHGNAPALKDSSADPLALILTAVDGEPLKGEESPARRRASHRQVGQLLRRFHEALPGHQAQDEGLAMGVPRAVAWPWAGSTSHSRTPPPSVGVWWIGPAVEHWVHPLVEMRLRQW